MHFIYSTIINQCRFQKYLEERYLFYLFFVCFFCFLFFISFLFFWTEHTSGPFQLLLILSTNIGAVYKQGFFLTFCVASVTWILICEHCPVFGTVRNSLQPQLIHPSIFWNSTLTAAWPNKQNVTLCSITLSYYCSILWDIYSFGLFGHFVIRTMSINWENGSFCIGLRTAKKASISAHVIRSGHP